MIKTKNQTLGITLGDPLGIGPEIVAKCINFLNKKLRVQAVFIICK